VCSNAASLLALEPQGADAERIVAAGHQVCPYSKAFRGPALPLVLRRTDGAHRRVVYSGSRRSRLHQNLRIKNGERVSLRGTPKAPRIYRAAWAAG
jgi:hypothetical protein